MPNNDSEYRHRKHNAVYVGRDIIESTALRSLKIATAIRVFLIFLTKRKYQRAVGRTRRSFNVVHVNNGELVFTYDEAERLGITRPRFQRALDEIIGAGLLDLTYQGSGLRGDESKYALSERWKTYGTPDFQVRKRPKQQQYSGFTRGHHLTPKRKKQVTPVLLEQVTPVLLEQVTPVLLETK